MKVDTTDGLRMLRDIERDVLEKIVESVIVEKNELSGVVAEVKPHPLDGRTSSLVVTFFLNMKRHTVIVDAPRDARFDREMGINALVNALAARIADSILRGCMTQVSEVLKSGD